MSETVKQPKTTEDLRWHQTQLDIGDEVWRVSFSRHFGRSYQKTHVEKRYKNGNVIVQGQQFRCRTSSCEKYNYTQTGNHGIFHTNDELWPCNEDVLAEVEKRKREVAHGRRCAEVQEGLRQIRLTDLSEEDLGILEDLIKRKKESDT